MLRVATCLLLLAPLALTATRPGDERQTIVACAPGYPGDTEQAQPTMDEFARAVARAGGWREGRFAAIYHERLEAGLARLAQPDAAVALVPLPFYLEFRERLSLDPLLAALPQTHPTESWSLVAARGALTSPSALAGWSLIGSAGYSDRFIRRVALGGWGALPADVGIEFDGRLLSSLRRAAQGERVAVLLDRAQADALGALPFARELEVVATSAPLPASLVCEVGDRMDAAERDRLRAALLGLNDTEPGREVLASLRLERFAAAPTEELRALVRAFGAAGD